MAYDWDANLSEEEQKEAPVIPNNADFLPSSESNGELDEVERRLEKAHFYRMLLKHQLISSDSDEAVEVEGEVQDFVRERLAVLLGIKPEPMLKASFVFSDEEVEALKAVAAKVLNKPTIVQAKPSEQPKPAVIVPVSEPKPQIRPATEPKPVVPPIRRTRGRPRKTTPSQPESPGMSKAEKEAAPKDDLKPGERIEVVGGKRYKVVQRVVNNPVDGKPVIENGKVKTVEHKIDITPPLKIPGVAPYPPQEQINALEASRAQEVIAMNPLAAALTPVAMTLPDTTQKDE